MIHTSNFTLGVKTKGEYAGREFLRLEAGPDKTSPLTLGNSEIRDEGGFHDHVANSKDEFCFIRIWKHYRFELLGRCYKGRFFLRPAYEKEIKVSPVIYIYIYCI